MNEIYTDKKEKKNKQKQKKWFLLLVFNWWVFNHEKPPVVQGIVIALSHFLFWFY